MKDQTGATELVFILDRSGSMTGLEGDTIGGYNAMLGRQRGEAEEAVVTTVLFDDQFELLHDRINLAAVEPITEKDYYVRGSTALLDAIGKTIGKIDNAQRHTAADHRAGKVLFVITTDGMENASREFTYEKVKKMIEERKESSGWEFIFLGANIDAIGTAAKMGIGANRAANFHADSVGLERSFDSLGSVVHNFMSAMPIEDDWKEDIDTDFLGRARRDKKKK